MRLSGFAQIVRRIAARPLVRVLLAALVLTHSVGGAPEPVRIVGLAPPTLERSTGQDALAAPRAPLAAPAAETAALPSPAPVADGDTALVVAASLAPALEAGPAPAGNADTGIPAPLRTAFHARAPPLHA